MILTVLTAIALTLTAPLTANSGDQHITLSKARGPFEKNAVIKLCHDYPSYTYVRVTDECPSSHNPWDIATPLRTFTSPPSDHVWWNSYPSAPVNTTIERIQATCKETCIWFGRPSTSSVLRDATVTRTAPASANKIDAGIKVGGSNGGVATSGVLIERVRSYGWAQVPHTGYANGDGLVVNRGVVDVTVRYSTFDNNADAGIDTKANLTVLDNVSASGNGHYGFRFWGTVNAGRLVSVNNGWGHIEAETGAHVVIEHLTAVGPEELVTTKKGAYVEIKSCDLSGWTGTAKTAGQGTVNLGPTC